MDVEAWACVKMNILSGSGIISWNWLRYIEADTGSTASKSSVI